MECSDGPAETSMIGETPPGRKGARAPRLSEASTVATSEQSSPSIHSPLTIQEEQMTRTQKRNRRRKEKRRENEEQKTRAKEQGPCFFTIHESDSDEWQSVCSEFELGYEDALSLYGGDSDDQSSEHPEEDVAEQSAECVETFL